MKAETARKYAALKGCLSKLESVAVAFSAGVDSTLLLKVATDVLGADNVLAVMGRSPSVPVAELTSAATLTD